MLSSGTMAKQVALRVLARPGDEVITSREAHAGWHETGGAAANAGVQLVEVGQGGLYTRDELEAAIKPRGLPVFPPTTVVQIENTHNRGGGMAFPQAEADRICAAARARGTASFGARLCNAAVASGRSEAELAGRLPPRRRRARRRRPGGHGARGVCCSTPSPRAPCVPSRTWT